MIAIDVHRTETEYIAVRTTKGRSAPEWISCRSQEELSAVLVVLGVTEWRVREVLLELEWSVEVEVRV